MENFKHIKPFFSVILGIILGLRCSFKVKGLWKEIVLIMFWVVIITAVTAKARRNATTATREWRKDNKELFLIRMNKMRKQSVLPPRSYTTQQVK